MTDDYETWEARCEEIRASNAVLLEDFKVWLRQKNLSDKTIKSHAENVDFYINEFLLYEAPTEPQDGADEISEFLGYWFIKKAMWASPAHIKGNAASLKKFYTFLHERGLVSADDLQELKETIKEEMSEWIGTVDRYDDPDITDMRDVWGF